MPYQIRLNMGLPEFAVQRAVREISKERERFTLCDIADYIQCHEQTVKASMRRLIQAGIVKRSGSRRKGFRYEVIEIAESA